MLPRLRAALKVYPVNGPLYYSNCVVRWSGGECYEQDSAAVCTGYGTVPSWMYGPERMCPETPDGALDRDRCYTSPGGLGVANSDLHIFVDADQAKCGDGGTLAYASSCQRDQVKLWR